jgi:hypothetical protein
MMKSTLIPGYRSLFDEPKKSYEKLLQDFSSDSIIQYLIGLNIELNSKDDHRAIQRRLKKNVFCKYTNAQKEKFENAISRYRMRGKDYYGVLFERRYLLHMIMKELKRNSKCTKAHDEPIFEFNFLLAYLLCVDEVHNNDRITNELKIVDKTTIGILKVIWLGVIDQYEFNQRANGGFEIYRLLCFFQYGFISLRQYMKELAQKNNFKNFSEILSSFYNLIKLQSKTEGNIFWEKIWYRNPIDESGKEYLLKLSINEKIDYEKISLSDIRKYPLYKTEDGRFMIIDEDMLTKKIYKGPLFETYYQTSLKNVKIHGQKTFEDYKTQVSKEALEKLCFKGIINAIKKSENDVIYFDNNSNSLPDLYFRREGQIILVEFKDYLFPDKVIDSTKINALQDYIDERFVKNENGTKKGISQLLNNIEILLQGKYEFDDGLNDLLESNGNICITSIIIHTDFMFGMPGINDYLNSVFKTKIKTIHPNVEIKDVTLVSLENLFHLSAIEKNLIDLIELTGRYWKIIAERRIDYIRNKNLNTFLYCMASFDEVYGNLFCDELRQNLDKTKFYSASRMLNSIGISEAFLSETL